MSRQRQKLIDFLQKMFKIYVNVSSKLKTHRLFCKKCSKICKFVDFLPKNVPKCSKMFKNVKKMCKLVDFLPKNVQKCKKMCNFVDFLPKNVQIGRFFAKKCSKMFQNVKKCGN